MLKMGFSKTTQANSPCSTVAEPLAPGEAESGQHPKLYKGPFIWLSFQVGIKKVANRKQEG